MSESMAWMRRHAMLMKEEALRDEEEDASQAGQIVCESLWDSGHILVLTYGASGYVLRIHDDLSQVRNADKSGVITVLWTEMNQSFPARME